MPIIHNSETLKELQETTKTQQGSENIPRAYSNQVVPVIDVNPKHGRITDIVEGVTATNSGSGAIYTSPATQDFYITGAQLSYDADTDSDLANCSITCIINGATKRLLYLAHASSVESGQAVSVTFSQPIKVDRNTAISLSRSFTAGLHSFGACVYGFVDKVSNG